MNVGVRLQGLQESEPPELDAITEQPPTQEEPKPAPLSFSGTLVAPLHEEIGQKGRLWEVVLVRSGWSKNGVYYHPDAIRKAVALLEGVGLPIARYKLTDTPDGHLPRRLRLARVEGPAGNVSGFVSQPRLVECQAGSVELRAQFHCVDEDVRRILVAAQEAGVSSPLGFSVDINGYIAEGIAEGRRGVICHEFKEFLETTLVASPAAGGRVVHLVASTDEEEGYHVNLRRLWEKRLRRLGRDVAAVATMTEKQLCEAVLQEGLGDKAVLSLAQEWLAAGKTEEVQQLLSKIIEELDGAGAASPYADAVMMESLRAAGASAQATAQQATVELQEAQKLRCGMLLDRALQGCELPDKAQEILRNRFADKVFAEAELQEAITEVKTLLGSAVPATGVAQSTRVQVVAETADRLTAEMGLVFGIRPDSSVLQESERQIYRDLSRGTASMRRMYELWFDDPGVTGNIGQNAIFQEATTANYVHTLSNLMNKALIQEYSEIEDFWEELVEIVTDIHDFKQRTDILWGGYSGLPIIGENDKADIFPFLANPAEVKSNWSVGQRGAMFQITRKMMKNDDLKAFETIPRRIARGARHELRQFIFNYLTASVGGTLGADAIYDGLALYHASHFNKTTDALAYTPLVDAWNRMTDQRLLGGKTELTADLTDSGTSASVTTTEGLAAGQTIKIEGELIIINAVTNATTLDITGGRGAFGTTAAAHTHNTATQPVYQLVDPIGLKTMHLVTPTQLAQTAFALLQSPNKPDTGNHEGNMLHYLASQGKIKAHSIHPMYLKRRTNVWFCFADKASAVTTKVGFMDNQKEPRILVQDAPTTGFVFTRLAITFQALHEYGASNLDYVGCQAGLPAA